MKVLELFSGLSSIGNAFARRGHTVIRVDWDKTLDADVYADIGRLGANDYIRMMMGRPDVIWASPDCTTYSVAALGKHRRRNPVTRALDPQTDYARQCDRTNAHVVDVIRALKPRFFFIENPRGGMRTMPFVAGIPRYTVTYCQYGDARMKPTDIWTNHPSPRFKPPCKNGAPCHEPAPRGSRTGTQGIDGHYLRSVIPAALCEHIVDICEGRAPFADEGIEHGQMMLGL